MTGAFAWAKFGKSLTLTKRLVVAFAVEVGTLSIVTAVWG